MINELPLSNVRRGAGLGLGLGLLELLLPLSLMHKRVVVMPVVGVDRGMGIRRGLSSDSKHGTQTIA